MISRVSENKTSGEFIRCRFLANETIRQSRVRSSWTAAQYHHQSSVHHMCAMCCADNTLTIGMTHSGGVSNRNIFTVVEQEKIIM